MEWTLPLRTRRDYAPRAGLDGCGGDWDSVAGDVSGDGPLLGDPGKSNEGILEAIQTAWHEEYVDAKG
jgi:hypothetical protein